jgi:hypothetical protein
VLVNLSAHSSDGVRWDANQPYSRSVKWYSKKKGDKLPAVGLIISPAKPIPIPFNNPTAPIFLALARGCIIRPEMPS